MVVENRANVNKIKNRIAPKMLIDRVTGQTLRSAFFSPFPTSRSGIGGDLAALLCGHSDHTALAATLPALTPDLRHVLRN